MQITKNQSILYATVYSCRIHNIPRLLGDIFYELERACGKRIRRSEKNLLKLLNRVSNKITNSELHIMPPNRNYYLQAYLAKIQDTVSSNTDEQYFEIIRARSSQQIKKIKSDPSTAAKKAILQSTNSILRMKLCEILK